MANIITATGIGKRYTLTHQQAESYTTLRDTLAKGFLHRPQRAAATSRQEAFWALRDVSFEIKQGDRVGIIGRNGAGKSTLLKILSRITEPTTGNIVLSGRVASLLEVGTGFHPELTGRENIYLNGAILGMNRQEITRKFDQIVAFADVERFLDTPVKRYSSGMYVRLAFAVAAHLEPEILIVDEVLAVGDAEFQKKCLGRLEEVGRDGRTVIFVSHNMGAIKQLCTRGILMERGQAAGFTGVSALIDAYQQSATKSDPNKEVQLNLKEQDIVFDDFRLNNRPFSTEPELFSADPLRFSLAYNAPKETKYDLCISYSIKNRKDGTFLIYTHNHLHGVRHKTNGPGYVDAVLAVPPLAPGLYSVEIQVWLDSRLVIDGREVGQFSIVESPAFGGNMTMASFPSALMLDTEWRFRHK